MKIEFNTDNAAFCNEDGEFDYIIASIEIGDIFKDITNKMLHRVQSGTILDINGNKIGEWSV